MSAPRGSVLLGAAAAAFTLTSATAVAHEIVFEFTIDGTQEVPPTNSPGTGFGVLVLDTHTNLIEWEITFSGLLGEVTGAHFHGPAVPGQNAGIQIDIGDISGLESPMIGDAEITDEQESFFIASRMYVNIHTTEFPGGEIRGQVIEPAPQLVIIGECPGPITIVSSGNTPANRVAFAYSRSRGSFVVPSGPCAGTELGLSAPVTLAGVVDADRKGDARLNANAPAAACDRIFLQTVDVLTCTPSEVVRL